MLLGDLGARVIKVEQTGQGDPFRSFRGELYSPHFQTYNRNKQSIELDTRRPEDLAVLDKLVAEADVFIQNFRPASPRVSASMRPGCRASIPASSMRAFPASVPRPGP